MIENEIHLISGMLTEGPDVTSNLINKLLTALECWTPTNSPTFMLPWNENLRVVIRFFSFLSVTDAGRVQVQERGPTILTVILSSKTQGSYGYQELRDTEDRLSFKANGPIN